MLKFAGLLFSLFIIFPLCSCSVPQDDLYEYFLQHPLELKKQASHCSAANDESERCEIALKAAEEMNALVMEQRQNPQKFGEEILQQEMAYSRDNSQDTADKIRVLLAVISLSSPE